MMVETILESSQDFGMSSGPLPQWKRELLQRRAARTRPVAAPTAPPPQPPPPPPPPEDDEELRYGPGIVKRLKSRYLSLALREAPRRRPSVLRRAASLEHLLDERPPPAPRPSARPARPVSLATPPPTVTPIRRDSVKRARSVDALSRLDEPPPPPAPPSPLPRAPRPPRRPAPLLRETERPPPDVVRSTLRKFETTPPRRTAPAARISAVVRGLEAPRTSTPEPRARSPSPATADISAIDELEGPSLSTVAKQVSRAALEGIARAGSTVRYSFESPKLGTHLPLLATTNPVLLNRTRVSSSPRRVGVIKPMPPLTTEIISPLPEDILEIEPSRLETPSPEVPENSGSNRPERKEPPPSAVVEPIPRSLPEESPTIDERSASRESTPEIDLKQEPQVKAESTVVAVKKPLTNGHAAPERCLKTAGVERAWTGASGAGSKRLRAAAPTTTSVVFNFSHRTEVPDYIENDGIVLRAARRNRFKAGESGVVLLKGAEVPAGSDSDGEGELDGTRSPSPCSVRFVNDNILINGRSSMLARTPLHRERAAKLKLQFDDSLTRTFEYPSETSLCEDTPDTPAITPALAANTTLGGNSVGGLSQYTPSKTVADTFQLGLTRTHQTPDASECKVTTNGERAETEAETVAENGDARPCAADSARSWSESRTHTTDLLF